MPKQNDGECIYQEEGTMSKKDGYSRPGLFGSINHYDSKGHKIGESRPGFFGGYNDYDAKGHKIGETRPVFFVYSAHDFTECFQSGF